MTCDLTLYDSGCIPRPGVTHVVNKSICSADGVEINFATLYSCWCLSLFHNDLSTDLVRFSTVFTGPGNDSVSEVLRFFAGLEENFREFLKK